MLIYSMSVSVDGYIAGRDGSFGWTAPSDELFAFHLARVRTLGAHLCGRKLYETMLPWEVEGSLRDTALGAEFAQAWSALPKIVFSRTLNSVQGAARLATASVAGEIAATLAATDRDVEIGGAQLAGIAFELGLVEELRIFRVPVVIGGGTPYLPPVMAGVALTLVESRIFQPHTVYERYRVLDTPRSEGMGGGGAEQAQPKRPAPE